MQPMLFARKTLMNSVKVISFQAKLDAFCFLGIENTLKEDADFEAFWCNFFDKGGYSKIEPYQLDPNCINVWYHRSPDEIIYFQGKIVCADAPVPEGYSMVKFPASEYLVVTTEWLSSYDESMLHINPSYYENACIPNGYVKHHENDPGIFMLERWGANTGEGYRYEFWLPIEPI